MRPPTAASEVPVDVFILEDCPHDWLFPRCAAVVSLQFQTCHQGATCEATKNNGQIVRNDKIEQLY
jgi:hypothetical protein